jgi:hypothetical protein
MPRGQRVNAALAMNFQVSVNNWRAVPFGPARWQCAVNARQAYEQRVVTEWSTRRPRVEGLRLRRSGEARELI